MRCCSRRCLLFGPVHGGVWSQRGHTQPHSGEGRCSLCQPAGGRSPPAIGCSQGKGFGLLLLTGTACYRAAGRASGDWPHAPALSERRQSHSQSATLLLPYSSQGSKNCLQLSWYLTKATWDGPQAASPTSFESVSQDGKSQCATGPLGSALRLVLMVVPRGGSAHGLAQPCSPREGLSVQIPLEFVVLSGSGLRREPPVQAPHTGAAHGAKGEVKSRRIEKKWPAEGRMVRRALNQTLDKCERTVKRPCLGDMVPPSQAPGNQSTGKWVCVLVPPCWPREPGSGPLGGQRQPQMWMGKRGIMPPSWQATGEGQWL